MPFGDFAHYYGFMMFLSWGINLFFLILMALLETFFNFRRYTFKGKYTLVYLSFRYFIHGLLWPFGMINNISLLWDDYDILAKLIKYDGSW